jgi:hypothetical protein
MVTTMPQTKDEAILKAYHFDLIYSHSRYLYTLIPNNPYPHPFEHDNIDTYHKVDGMIGYMGHVTNPYGNTTTYRDSHYGNHYGCSSSSESGISSYYG